MQNHLERLIKQTIPFSSRELKAQIGLLYLSYSLNSIRQAQFKQYNLTLQQYNILRILRGQFPRPANISLLRDRMLDKMSDVSRLIDRLCSQELVSKQPNDIDKRNADVMITEKALLLLEEIDELGLDKQSVFKTITSEELDTFNELIDKLLAGL